MTGPPPYGDAARALLAAVAESVDAAAGPVSDRFFARLESLPGPAGVLARLTPEESVRLRASQAAHFRRMMDPAVGETAAAEAAATMGRVHSLVAVEIDWFASAFADYEEGVLRELGATAADGALKAVLHQRVSHELRNALAGYRQVLAGQARALGRISRVAHEAETLADLLRGALDGLAAMEGISAVLFGRPDDVGRFQFEAGAGGASRRSSATTPTRSSRR